MTNCAVTLPTGVNKVVRLKASLKWMNPTGLRLFPAKRGRDASGKTIVFGIFKRQDKVCTKIVPDTKKKMLQRIIRDRIILDSSVHSDGCRSYDGWLMLVIISTIASDMATMNLLAAVKTLMVLNRFGASPSAAWSNLMECLNINFITI